MEPGYPRLIAAGRALAADGIRFHDLSGLFAGIEEPLYVDSRRPVGRRGNEIVADAIAAAIRDDPPRGLSRRARR